ncbi:MAG: tetratricopeptide repeat protein [Cyanobacteria bacterium P01_E01_bin.42]
MNQSSQGDDIVKQSRAIGMDGNTIQGSGYTEQNKGSVYTGGDTYFYETNYYGGRSQPSKAIAPYPHYIPLSGAVDFFGRDADLDKLHQHLQESQRIAITAMGGMGKTELALQYAKRYREPFYPGGVCWLPSRDADVGLRIVDFARVHLQMNPPEDLTLEQRVRYCWQNWPISGDILAVLDDVIDYKKVKPFLPPDDSRFKVIITTRSQRLHQAFVRLNLEVLTADASLEMLQSLIGGDRIEAELETAKGLCEWLGYLPLGLELVGQYLEERKDLSLAEMRRRLDKKRLEQTALKEYTTEATAERGVKAAFELSWQELPENAREVACLLSLFAVAPIPWELVQECFDWDEEELEDVRDRFLVKLSLLERSEAGRFQLHQLLQRFMKDKLEESETADLGKQKYCKVMVDIAQQIPQKPTLKQVEKCSVLIPHLEVIVKSLCNWIENKDLITPFEKLAFYYEGQGFYKQAEFWCEKCLLVSRDRLGEESFDITTPLNNLAEIRRSQGKYEEAEPLYLKAIELCKKHLVEEHFDFATLLNNLALLYHAQGKDEEAEPLFLQALDLRKKLLGKEQFFEIANSLNNLAFLYHDQEKYEEAKPLYLQAIELYKINLVEEHPNIAFFLDNLAGLYYAQEKYEESESLYLQAIELRKKLLGEEHPDFATSLNNLASLYNSQGKYEKAEPLFSNALEISVNRLNIKHPHIRSGLQNLGDCLLNAIAAGQRDQLSNHPLTQQLLAQIDAANETE